MSSTYCIQLGNGYSEFIMTTTKPVNFPSLQFSLSVNSLVIFLFSKYPFNYNTNGNLYVNFDEFGFAQVGTSFNIDLTNYQGYYMLIIIVPSSQSFTMTFEIQQFLQFKAKQ